MRDVTSYGATPNDGQNDDTAINNAINASTAGDTIQFPAGVYNISSTLTLKSDRTYTGGGTLKRSGSNVFAVQTQWDAGRDLTLAGLTLDGGGISFAGSGAVKATNINIRNCTFRNVTHPGYPFYDAIYIPIGGRNCAFMGNTFTNVGGGLAAWNIYQCQITDNWFDTVGQGISIQSDGAEIAVLRNTGVRLHRMGIEFQCIGGTASNSVIEDNHFSNWDRPYADSFGLSVVPPRGPNISVRYNTLLARPPAPGTWENRYGYGIEVANDILCRDNFVEGHWWNGIVIGGGNTIVSNNVCRGPVDGQFKAPATISFEPGSNPPTVIITNNNLQITSSYIEAPDHLRLVRVSTNRVDLAWNDLSTNEDGFKVERRTPGGSYALLATLPASATSYTDIDVVPDAEYVYRLHAFNATGSETYSPVILVTMPGLHLAQTATWTRWEQALTGSQSYANPYSDVIVTVVYTGPAGQTFSTYGFWDGGNTWKIRCAFPSPGIWTWQTSCSNTGDSGLHSRTGQVTVTAYSGINPLYSKGFLKVVVPNRYLTYDDNSPFFWAADTPWIGPFRGTDAEWRSYVDQRRDQKFSVLQLALAPAWGGTNDAVGNTPFLGWGITKWNPAFWQGYESKVEYANNQGLIVCIVGVDSPTIDKPMPPVNDAKRFARLLAARLYGNHVVFSPSFDDDTTTTTQADAVGTELKATTTRHLITLHPGTDWPTIQAWHGKPYTDFTGVQSGAGWAAGDINTPAAIGIVADNAVNWVNNLYNISPTNRPLINMEARYDDVYISSYLPRIPISCGYWSILNGTAGFTYGCNGIWSWGDASLDPWSLATARSRPTAVWMRYLTEFFTARAWWTLRPASSLIGNQSSIGIIRMALAKSVSGDLAVAYLPDNPSIQINVGVFPAHMKATWFNCEAGTYTAGPADVINSGSRTFNRPAAGQWALVLEPTIGSAAIKPDGSSNVVVTWNGHLGLRLQSTINLCGSTWQDMPGTDSQSTALLPTDAAARFYRLIQF